MATTITDTAANGAAAATDMDIDTEATTASMMTTDATSREVIQALQDEHYLDHLTEEPLRTLALEATAASTVVVAGDSAAASASATVRVEALEIGLRLEMLKRLQSIMLTTSTTATTSISKSPAAYTYTTAVGCFWKSALCLCWHLVFMSENVHENTAAASITTTRRSFQGLSLVRKIPFLLLEDVLDSLPTLDQCRQFWNDAVQPSFDLLFHPHVMWTPTSSSTTNNGPCWLPFLKISNKYIRRAAHHPSSSSSSNIVNNAGALTSCTVMSTLCNVFPMAEKSATRPWGSHNADHVSSFETLQEFETNNSDTTAADTAAAVIDTGGGDDDDGAIPDYSFYESFWKLQDDLSNPNAIKVADFMQRLKTLITAMENTSTSTTTTSTQLADSKNEKPLYQPKYLTSSRLLSIQLSHDVDFRRHILCQVLVVIHHLSHQVPVLKSKLDDAQQRAMRLLSSTTPQDKSSASLNIVDFLQSLLQTSELQWRNWKKNKCVQDLDQRQSEPLKIPKATTTLSATTTTASSVSGAGGRKRKRLESSHGPLSNADNNEDNDEDDDDELDMTQSIRLHGGALQSISRRMRGVQPTIEHHLSDYVEALDPDAGIEAEYHPKTNSLFCWRAVRLLLSSSSSSSTTATTPTTNGNDRAATSSSTTSYLQDFAQISPSGDFEALVREMYKQKGVHIPGETPIYQQDDELDEVEEEKQDERATESEHNSPKDDDDEQEEENKDVDIKMKEEDVKMDVMENGENKKETEHKKNNPAPSDDGNDSEPVIPMAGVVNEEHNHRQPDDEPSEMGDIDSLHPTKIVASNMPIGNGGQNKDIVASAPVNGAPPQPRQQKGNGGGHRGGNTGKDIRPGNDTAGSGRGGGHQRSRSPSDRRGDDHSKAAIISNPPQGDNNRRGAGAGGGGPRGGRLSPVVHGPSQTAALGGRQNQSENDLSRRSAGAGAGPQQAHAGPPAAARGGGGGPIPPDRRVDHGHSDRPPDRRVDHAPQDRRHEGPPPGQRRSGGGGGGDLHVDRGPHADRGPHIDRDDQRRGGGGGGGGARALNSNNGPRGEDRGPEDRGRMEADRRGGAADDDRRGSGGEDRRGGGGGGDDRNRGGDRGDWRPRGGGGGGRDQSRGRHGRR